MGSNEGTRCSVEHCRVDIGSLIDEIFHHAHLWARSFKKPDVSMGPLARPFAHTAHSFACFALRSSLARSGALTHSLAHSLRSLALLTPSLVGKWDDWITIFSVFSAVLDHSAVDSRDCTDRRRLREFRRRERPARPENRA